MMYQVLVGSLTGALVFGPSGLMGYGAAVGAVLGVYVGQAESSAKRRADWPVEVDDSPLYRGGVAVLTAITVLSGFVVLLVGNALATAF